MSVNTKMKAIADEIRELSGTTEAMGLDAMATNIGAANDEVDSQTELLAQVLTALEGKAGGGSGGGESMKYITGTFTVTSTGGSVSGLGFTPKHVVASLASTLDLPTAYTEKAVLFVQGGLCSNSVAYDVMNKSIVSGATSYGHIDILDDGFTIGTGTGVIKGTFYDGTDWNYLAIG